jgi:hypothetical protein
MSSIKIDLKVEQGKYPLEKNFSYCPVIQKDVLRHKLVSMFFYLKEKKKYVTILNLSKPASHPINSYSLPSGITVIWES